MHLLRRELFGLFLSASVQGCRCEDTQSTGSERLAIDTAVRYQTFEGFGSAVLAWVPELQTFFQSQKFADLFLDVLGASVLRIDLWQGCVPPASRWETISKDSFVFEGSGARGQAWLGAAETIVRASAGRAGVIASVWSPPAWMKVNGHRGHGGGRELSFALSGQDLARASRRPRTDEDPARLKYLHANRLRPDRYRHFAKAICEWVRLLGDRGISLYGLSLQNEPRFSHWFESCTYTPLELAELHRVVVEMFSREGVPLPPLFLPETMSHDLEANQRYVGEILANQAVSSQVRAIATHGYTDGYKADEDPESLLKLRSLAGPYGKPIWLTEGGTGSHDWPGPLHSLAASMMNALLYGDVSLVTPWQAVGASPSTHDLAGLEGPTKKTFVAAQFFRHIRPGMTRVQITQPRDPGASCVAFRSPSGERVVVVFVNRQEKQVPVSLEVSGAGRTRALAFLTDAARNHSSVDLNPKSLLLPPESVLTLVLQVSQLG